MNTILKKRLRMLRTEYEKTQSDVAKILKVNRSTYGAYESGKIMPPAEKCKILADYFHVSLDYLLGYTDVRGIPAKKTDHADISDIITSVLHQLENDKESVSFEGDEIGDDVKEVLADSLSNTLRLVKMLKKGMKK